MEKWEYITKFVAASIDRESVEQYLRQQWPNRQKQPKFTPLAMVPELNAWGDKGWEVIHMQPVWIGKNHDIHNYGYSHEYTNVFFCVMKRRKQ